MREIRRALSAISEGRDAGPVRMTGDSPQGVLPGRVSFRRFSNVAMRGAAVRRKMPVGRGGCLAEILD